MQSLNELQRAFAAYLLSTDDAERALLDAVEPHGTHSDVRLEIYRNNVIARLIGALADTYPAVERLVGKEFFRYAARVYIGDHPPASSLLLEYGAAFPDFLRSFRPADSVPYLSDVARLEQLYVEAYHAADALPSSAQSVLEKLTADDERQCRLRLHPSARLMASAYPVSRIWEVNRRDAAISKLKIPGQAEHLLVIRPAAVVEVRRIPAGAYALLRSIAADEPLRCALAAGRAAEPDAALEDQVLELAAAGTFSSMGNVV